MAKILKEFRLNPKKLRGTRWQRMSASYEMEQLVVVDVVKDKVLFTTYYTQDNARCRAYRVSIDDVLRPHGRFEFVAYKGELDWLGPMCIAWVLDRPSPSDPDLAGVAPIARITTMAHHRVTLEFLHPEVNREHVTWSWPELRKKLRPCTQEEVNAHQLKVQEEANRRAAEGVMEAVDAPRPSRLRSAWVPPVEGLMPVPQPDPLPLSAEARSAWTRLDEEAEQLSFPFQEAYSLSQDEAVVLRRILAMTTVIRLAPELPFWTEEPTLSLFKRFGPSQSGEILKNRL